MTDEDNDSIFLVAGIILILNITLSICTGCIHLSDSSGPIHDILTRNSCLRVYAMLLGATPPSSFTLCKRSRSIVEQIYQATRRPGLCRRLHVMLAYCALPYTNGYNAYRITTILAVLVGQLSQALPRTVFDGLLAASKSPRHLLK